MSRIVSDEGSTDGFDSSRAGGSGSATFISVVPQRTYSSVSREQLERLCRALGLNQQQVGEYLTLQELMFQPWNAWPIPSQPAYPSAIGDDHSPYEYSIAASGSGFEFRILFEAQDDVPSAAGNQRRALEVNTRLAEKLGVNFSKFDKVADLFLRAEPEPPFSIWHAACLSPGKAPAFKIYLNPAAQGAGLQEQVIAEALGRLGFSRKARSLLGNAARRGHGRDEIRYFSLDLSARPDARVKVYFVHPNATAAELESAFSHAPSHRSGDVADYCVELFGHEGPFVHKPFTSCFSFVRGSDVPTAVTLHAPVAHYLKDDAEIARRVERLIAKHHLPLFAYRNVLRALSARPLERGPGLQSYVSYRREKSGLRLTSYLSPELFSGSAESGLFSLAEHVPTSSTER